MGAIFLSYARENRASAEKLARVLEEAGHKVWWDRHLDAGEEFADEIEAALAQSDAVLVAWSKESVKSRWVRDEASIGCDTGRLVPITIDGTQPPMGFRQFHTLELANWTGSKKDPRTAELLAAIGRRLQPETAGSSAPRVNGDSRSEPRWRNRVVAAILALAAIVSASVYWLGDPRSVNRTNKPTLAILPFTTNSSDTAAKALASGARESAAHRLADSGMPTRLVETATPDSSVSADYYLLGEISDSSGQLVATIRLEDAHQRETVWSRRYEADRAEASRLADRIGAQIAGTLGWGGALRMLDRKEAPDPNLTADLLRMVDLAGDPLQGYQISQRLAAKWPKSGMVQLSLAMNTGFVLNQLPREQRPTAVTEGRRAAERSKELMPDFGDTYIPVCLLQPTTRIKECDVSLRAGLVADPDAPFVNSFLAYTMSGAGRTKEAFEFARLSYVHDPYMPAKIATMIRMLAWTGDDVEARRLYHQGTSWWPESGLLWDYLSGLILRGDFEAIATLQDELGPKEFSDYAAIGSVARAVLAKDAARLASVCNPSEIPFLQTAECMLGFAAIGDLDHAFALADTLYPGRVARTSAEEERAWLDQPAAVPLDFIVSVAAAPMRKDPRFIQLAQRTALVRFWAGGSSPDFCLPPAEAVCTSFRTRR